MDSSRIALCILIISAALATFYMVFIHHKTTQGYSVGITEISFADHSRMFDNQPRMVHLFVWYPAKKGEPTQHIDYDIWKIADAAKGASPLEGKFPLILFSHGYSGHPYANSWFAEYLAAHGYIVASIQHYGNSFPQSMIPEISARPWNRPLDMSLALDHLLAHPVWKNHIDKHKIGASGFSQGGMGALWLAGITGHLTREMLKKQITFIDDPSSRSRHFKGLPQDRLDAVLPNFTQEDFDQANRSYRDNRIKAVVALAPGIDREHPMFTKEGLSRAQVPAYIIAGEGDQEDVTASLFFTQHIPNCTLSLVPGKVTHWTFLNEATEQGKKINPFITVDDPSINRAQVHKQIGSMALAFFNDKLTS